MAPEEVFVSTDIETDGPIPGPYSMLSLGSAAYREDGSPLGVFSVNLETLPGASGHPETMTWWAGFPAAWARCRADPSTPADAMKKYAAWLKALPGKPVFVAYPAGFDFTFVHWYLVRFTGDNPFSFSALDMKTYAMSVLGTRFRETTKKTMPPRWFGPEEGTPHVALDDAVNQARLFFAMRRDAATRVPHAPPRDVKGG